MKTMVKRLILFLFLGAVNYPALSWQQDDFYLKARNFSSSGEFDLALQQIQAAKALGITGYDYLLLESLVYGWSGNLDSANSIIDGVIKKWPESREAKETKIKFQYWSTNYPEAIQLINELDTASAEMLLLKINSLILSGRKSEVLRIFEENKELIEIPELNKIHKTLKKESAKNQISVDLSFAKNYTTNQNWIWTDISYSRKFNKLTFIPAITIANLYDKTGLEYRLDFYTPVFSTTYIHLNLESSPDPVFPDLTLGSTLFQTLPYKFEISAGARFFKIDSIWHYIGSGSLSKYLSKNWISYKIFVHLDNPGFAPTHCLIVRRYFRENFLELSMSQGPVPLNIEGVNEFTKISSRIISLGYEFPAGNTGTLKANMAWQSDQISDRNRSNRFTLSLGYRFAF